MLFGVSQLVDNLLVLYILEMSSKVLSLYRGVSAETCYVKLKVKIAKSVYDNEQNVESNIGGFQLSCEYSVLKLFILCFFTSYNCLVI